MSLTKNEVYEYLAAYPQETIPSVLAQLGCDENTEDYPEDIVERAEGIYQAMGIAADMQKQLAGATSTPDAPPQTTDIVVQQVGAIAFQLLEQQGISLPIEVIAALAQSKVQESIELADKVSELQKRTFAKRLAHNQTEFAKDLLRLASKPTEAIDAILSDEAQAQWIEAAVPQQSQLNGDVRDLVNMLNGRAKAQKQIQGQRQEEVKALPQQDPKKVLGAFLAAMKG